MAIVNVNDPVDAVITGLAERFYGRLAGSARA
jgi:hypothetical protein